MAGLSAVNTFIKSVVVNIINPLIYLAAAVAFVVFLWGVFEFIRKAGDATARETGQKAIFWGLIGLVIIFGAYGIINFALGIFNLSPVTHISG